jgi:hypothetical protein
MGKNGKFEQQILWLNAWGKCAYRILLNKAHEWEILGFYKEDNKFKNEKQV